MLFSQKKNPEEDLVWSKQKQEFSVLEYQEGSDSNEIHPDIEIRISSTLNESKNYRFNFRKLKHEERRTLEQTDEISKSIRGKTRKIRLSSFTETCAQKNGNIVHSLLSVIMFGLFFNKHVLDVTTHLTGNLWSWIIQMLPLA